jgi:hypothetical protein
MLLYTLIKCTGVFEPQSYQFLFYEFIFQTIEKQDLNIF